MCPSAPRVCSEPGGQKPVLSLSLDRIRFTPNQAYISCASLHLAKAVYLRTSHGSWMLLHTIIFDSQGRGHASDLLVSAYSLASFYCYFIQPITVKNFTWLVNFNPYIISNHSPGKLLFSVFTTTFSFAKLLFFSVWFGVLNLWLKNTHTQVISMCENKQYIPRIMHNSWDVLFIFAHANNLFVEGNFTLLI